MWMSYGALKADNTLTLVNAVGLFIQSGYIVVFYAYTADRVSAHLLTELELSFSWSNTLILLLQTVHCSCVC